jgi:hypothetical protein
MTYGELREIKTSGFNTNHIIDDVVNNAIFAYGTRYWKTEEVSERDKLKIIQFANREGVTLPFYKRIVIAA